MDRPSMVVPDDAAWVAQMRDLTFQWRQLDCRQPGDRATIAADTAVIMADMQQHPRSLATVLEAACHVYTGSWVSGDTNEAAWMHVVGEAVDRTPVDDRQGVFRHIIAVDAARAAQQQELDPLASGISSVMSLVAGARPEVITDLLPIYQEAGHPTVPVRAISDAAVDRLADAVISGIQLGRRTGPVVARMLAINMPMGTSAPHRLRLHQAAWRRLCASASPMMDPMGMTHGSRRLMALIADRICTWPEPQRTQTVIGILGSRTHTDANLSKPDLQACARLMENTANPAETIETLERNPYASSMVCTARKRCRINAIPDCIPQDMSSDTASTLGNVLVANPEALPDIIARSAAFGSERSRTMVYETINIVGSYQPSDWHARMARAIIQRERPLPQADMLACAAVDHPLLRTAILQSVATTGFGHHPHTSLPPILAEMARYGTPEDVSAVTAKAIATMARTSITSGWKPCVMTAAQRVPLQDRCEQMAVVGMGADARSFAYDVVPWVLPDVPRMERVLLTQMMGHDNDLADMFTSAVVTDRVTQMAPPVRSLLLKCSMPMLMSGGTPAGRLASRIVAVISSMDESHGS